MMDEPLPRRDTGDFSPYEVHLSGRSKITVAKITIGSVVTILGAIAGFALWVDARYQSVNEAKIQKLEAQISQAAEFDRRDVMHEEKHRNLERKMSAQGQVLLNVRDNVNALVRDSGRRPQPLPSSVDVEDLVGAHDP